MDKTFKKQLANLLNEYSMENESNTPDFILAQYLVRCLNAFECAVNARERFYDRPLENQTTQATRQISCDGESDQSGD